MARAIWSGSITFGLVWIPVGLYSATEDHTVHFNQFERDTSKLSDIDPVFFQKTYWLAPDNDDHARQYDLLAAAMRRCRPDGRSAPQRQRSAGRQAPHGRDVRESDRGRP